MQARDGCSQSMHGTQPPQSAAVGGSPLVLGAHCMTTRSPLSIPAGRSLHHRALPPPPPETLSTDATGGRRSTAALQIQPLPRSAPMHLVQAQEGDDGAAPPLLPLPTRLLTPRQAEVDHQLRDTYNFLTIQVCCGWQIMVLVARAHVVCAYSLLTARPMQPW